MVCIVKGPSPIIHVYIFPPPHQQLTSTLFIRHVLIDNGMIVAGSSYVYDDDELLHIMNARSLCCGDCESWTGLEIAMMTIRTMRHYFAYCNSKLPPGQQ